MKKGIYLDHAASGLLHPEVQKKYIELLENHLGNAASIHQSGVKANLELEKARSIIAQRIHARSEENILFTSGATEANNLVLIGSALKNLNSSKKSILISEYEHSCIIRACDFLENTHQFNILKVKIKTDGTIDLEDLKSIIESRNDILLASFMHVNNEIGSFNDLLKISHLLKAKDILFHSDGAQGFCKEEINVEELMLDFYSMSGHKIHAPKGIGALYVRDHTTLRPILYGGNQEFTLRSGTVPFELASAMAFATTFYTPSSLLRMKETKDYLVQEIIKNFDTIVTLNTDLKNSSAAILNLRLKNQEAKALLHFLSKSGVYISVGSACNAGKTAPSRVLKSIGLSDAEALESIRIGLGTMTTKDEIDFLISTIKAFLNK